MAEALKRSSPLVALGRDRFAAPAQTVALEDRSQSGKIDIRGNPADSGFRENIVKALGLDPPRPKRTAMQEDNTLLWLAPGEWLLVCPSESEIATVAALASAGIIFTPVSDGWGALRLAGTQARDVLKKGTGLNIHPKAFAVGHCARTRLAQCAVLLHHVDLGSYDIYCERSFMEYLWLWLEDAAAEFAA